MTNPIREKHQVDLRDEHSRELDGGRRILTEFEAGGDTLRIKCRGSAAMPLFQPPRGMRGGRARGLGPERVRVPKGAEETLVREECVQSAPCE